MDDEVAHSITLAGFDAAGEPELRLMKNGHLYIVFNFMPPSDCEDDSVFDTFDEELADALGVEVDWEDRECFLVQSPRSDTVERATAFLSSYRKNQAMRRFEMVEGAASKFWEVSVDDAELTVRFGRIGTAGQVKVRECDDASAARGEREKLIREKTRKGYLEVDPG